MVYGVRETIKELKKIIISELEGEEKTLFISLMERNESKSYEELLEELQEQLLQFVTQTIYNGGLTVKKLDLGKWQITHTEQRNQHL